MSEKKHYRKTLIFIPTFNDHEHLDEIVAALHALSPNYRSLIIDDGSSPPIEVDGFKDLAMACRIPTNVGIGVATMLAVEHACRTNYDYLVRVDGDGPHPVDVQVLV